MIWKASLEIPWFWTALQTVSMRPGKVSSSLPRGVGPLPDWRGDCGFAVAVFECLSGSRLREETAKLVQLSLSPGPSLGNLLQASF